VHKRRGQGGRDRTRYNGNMVALTSSPINESYVEPSPYSWLCSRAPVPTSYAPACAPLYPFQEILENRTSRARRMTDNCAEVPGRKYIICIEIWQVELESCVWRVSFHKYAYVHGDPVQGIDPTGMFAANSMGEFLWTLTMGPPGIGDSIQGALQSLVTAYAINLEWDVKWATDWTLADDLNTRQDNSWVEEAMIGGALAPWIEWMRGLDFTSDLGVGGGGIVQANAAIKIARNPRLGLNGPRIGSRLGTSIKFDIGSVKVHAVSLGKQRGYRYDTPGMVRARPDTRFDTPIHDVPDGRLAARAKAFRERNGLLNRADLAGRNVAVAKIEVNGKEGFIEKASLNGAHSEQLIEGRVLQLRAAGHDVKVKEIYSERIPCNANGCTAAINRSMPGANVFFHTKNHGDRAASDLLRAYGL
jgi:hypothetical protein